jgi:hypothetical protein
MTVRARLAVAGLLVLLVAAIAAATALASVRVSRAELIGGRLRIEGTAIANRSITVDGVAMTTSDANGSFRLERASYPTPSDCIVDVNDGSATPTPARLSGCTVPTTTPPPTTTKTGTIAIVPGGNGHGRITSQPAGINCVIAATGVTGPCQAFFPAGITVRLDARPAADSQFQGWRGLPGCARAPDVTVFANTVIACQPGFALRF